MFTVNRDEVMEALKQRESLGLGSDLGKAITLAQREKARKIITKCVKHEQIPPELGEVLLWMISSSLES